MKLESQIAREFGLEDFEFSASPAFELVLNGSFLLQVLFRVFLIPIGIVLVPSEGVIVEDEVVGGRLYGEGEDGAEGVVVVAGQGRPLVAPLVLS